MHSTFVWIVVLHVSAFGQHGTILSDDARHRMAFENLDECRKAIPRIRKQVKLPAMASLDDVACLKMELKR